MLTNSWPVCGVGTLAGVVFNWVGVVHMYVSFVECEIILKTRLKLKMSLRSSN